MFNGGYGNNGDFEALARQYWGAWGDAMRKAGLGGALPAPPPPAAPGWQQAMDWWSQLLPREPSQANDALGRFNQQARDWYGQMQQVAAQFAGRDSSAPDITQAWRQALGASGANPFPEMFKSMSGKGLHGLDDWIEKAKPFLDSIQRDAGRWLHLPAFGQHREQQERLQALVQAQLDHQQRSNEFNALMGSCAQRAFEVFESKLAEHEEPGRQITSARGLFDLWIDAAEQAYSEVALSAEFRKLSGALTNAQMRLRGAVQKEVELLGAQFGMPTRTEVDSAHRKIAELERTLRRAAAAAERAGSGNRSVPVAAPAREKKQPARAASPAAATARKPGGSATARKSTAARGTGTRSAAGKVPARSASRAAPARKRAPAAATLEQKRAPATRSKAPAPSRSAPRGTAPAKAAKAASRRKAAAPIAASTTGAAGAKAVSMKDWVARNSAAADREAATRKTRKPPRKQGARK